jgi:NAD(P)H-hydrate epimerase
MKILTAEQTRQADQATIRNEPIDSIDLMERASSAFVGKFLDYFSNDEKPVFVFSGPGNNGGDGLAIARMLLEQEYEVHAYTVHAADKGSEDFSTNLTRLQKKISVENMEEAGDIPDIPDNAIVVDGMFGSGLSRKVEGIFAEVIGAINRSEAIVVAIDIPSGLYADKPLDERNDPVIRADFTFTFQMPKLTFMLPQYQHFVGHWEAVDIGLDAEIIDQMEVDYYFVDKTLARALHLLRHRFAHKGDFGKSLIISGSYGKMGAAILCARACLKSGVGLLTMHVPECGYQIMQTANPEAMTTVDRHLHIFTDLPQEGATSLDKYDVLGAGPGLGTHEESVEALRRVLQAAKARRMPLVLDADALNICGKHRELLNELPPNAILTPHPKEFERLTEAARDDFHRLELLTDFCSRYQVYVVLKGAHTATGTPDGKICFNSSGNPGMASGGTGDALTGIITALRSQKYDALDAALLGVYLHGLAGDLAVDDHGEESMIASDLIDYLGAAFRTLY